MNEKLATVTVFMSTYNGEKYIREQIDSIINQKDVDVYLWIRDDNSTDNTVEIINNYNMPDRIHIEKGENLGFEKSFATISRMTDYTDYFAFSDQDDVWSKSHLIDAINMMKKHDGAALYGSNLWITDGNLKVERSLYSKKQAVAISVLMEQYGIFGENMYACTMVWNKDLQKILMKHMPSAKVSQDVWTQLVAEIMGAKVLFDYNPTIKHRIHGNNTAGIAKSNLQRIKKAIRIYVRSDISPKHEIVKEAIGAYQDTSDETKLVDGRGRIRNLVKDYPRSIKNKIKLLSSECFRRKQFKRFVFCLYLVAINRY